MLKTDVVHDEGVTADGGPDNVEVINEAGDLRRKGVVFEGATEAHDLALRQLEVEADAVELRAERADEEGRDHDRVPSDGTVIEIPKVGIRASVGDGDCTAEHKGEKGWTERVPLLHALRRVDHVALEKEA